MSNILVYASYVITVLPMIFGLVKWNSLPDKMAIHFGMDGTPNGYASKLVTVVIIPLSLLIIQFICIKALNKNKESIALGVAIIETWLVPVVSIIIAVVTYRFALK